MKNCLGIFCVLAALSLGAASARGQETEIKTVADYLAHALGSGPRRTVAVVDFTDLQNNVTPLGRFIAEELESALVNSGAGLDLVDRTRLQLLLQENKLASTGIIDPATARRLGKIAGVQVLITGTLTPLENTVRISVKAIDTEDARVVAATSNNILRTQDIEKLIGTEMPVTAPAETRLTAPPLPPGPEVFESNDVRITLNGCERSTSSIRCQLTILSVDEDREIGLPVGRCHDAKPRLIDNLGREIMASETVLGSKRTGCGYLEATLVANTPTRTEVHFDNVPRDLTEIRLLELDATLRVGPRMLARFHQVRLVPRPY